MSVATISLELRRAAHVLGHDDDAYRGLIERIGPASVVLIGEASHGTHEFYRERARLTRSLIRHAGFQSVAVEGDWPDCWRVDRWVRGHAGEETANEALGGFARFPTWMWRNADVLDFVGWLRDWNEHHAQLPVGFYGLDLYAMHRAMRLVIDHLDRVNPAAAARARARYACLDRFESQPQAYGYAVEVGAHESCEEYVIQQLLEMLSRSLVHRGVTPPDPDETFHAQQCARLVMGAEAYYRAIYRGPAASWNLRDQHMYSTLEALVAHLRERGGTGKVVVWAHNSHLGDARATDMRRRGELNLGELVRRKWQRDAFLIGQTTYRGTVTAAHDWDGPACRMTVRPGLPDSHEDLLHRVGLPRFWLDLDPRGKAAAALSVDRLERFIGVIYRPETERLSHYYHANLSGQFDAVLHFDETRAVEPLERTGTWEAGELSETFPSGL